MCKRITWHVSHTDYPRDWICTNLKCCQCRKTDLHEKPPKDLNKQWF